jgi:methyltransferase-like protein/SAM-dependent methyltransferase
MADFTYDEVPYHSEPLLPTHPDSLATLAQLAGLTPPPVESCRVLELGCASGGNLIAMADAMPGARFVGIDLSPRQIAMGNEMVQRLGLDNIELRTLGIADADEGIGTFDYIVCHGVYSWVPSEVREKILSILATRLADSGLGYVSYNVYPGWHSRQMLREMMMHHVRGHESPVDRVREARGFVEFLSASVMDPESTYARYLKEESNYLRGVADSYLVHEHLESYNDPIYFHQFAAALQRHGLRYVGDSGSQIALSNLAPTVRQALAPLAEADPLELEQYIDFISNRTFRRSVVCRGGAARVEPAPFETVQRLRATGVATPASPRADLRSTVTESFRAGSYSISTNRPLIKATLHALHEVYPRALAFDELWREVKERLAKTDEPDPARRHPEPAELARTIYSAFLSNMIGLHTWVPSFALALAPRPTAGRLARLQAARGRQVTNRRHRVVELNELERVIVEHLDGTRDRAQLLDALVAAVERGALQIASGGQPLRDLVRARAVLDQSVDQALRRIAASALLAS